MKFRLPAAASAALNDNARSASTATDIPASVNRSASHDDVEKRDHKHLARNDGAYASDSSSEILDDNKEIDNGAQHGTQQAQAINQVWSNRDLIVAFIFIWLLEFVLAFGNGVTGTLTPYVTSLFQQHSLTALTGVISSLIAGIFKLPYAKIMDIWGRPQALTLGVALITLGCIMMAGVNNVETYCAAQVFYWMGYNCIDLSVVVFIADNTKLKNRGFMLAYTTSPFIITTWVYGYAANDLVYGSTGIKWGFGIFAILYPFVSLPWLAMLYIYQRRADKLGLIPARPSRGSFFQTVVYYCKEFDVVGLLILATGLSLFLLAFNIYSYQPDTWKSPLIICFIVFGALLIISFGLWERFLAPVTFIPWPLLKNRTVIFTYVMAASLYIGWYIWDSYFFSLLVVLFDQPIVYATYVSNIYTVGSCFFSLVYGLLLRYYGKLKWYSLFLGAPLTILGVGLMIKFRQPDQGIGGVVASQVLVAAGGAILVISEQTTLMAVSRQRDFPALLAVEAMVIAIGSAIGSTIAGAIWTGVFPVKLQENLPADALADFASIYGVITTQSSYPVGSPTRDAINLSYAETQRYMLIAATCIYSITLFSIALWQNVDVRKGNKVQKVISTN